MLHGLKNHGSCFTAMGMGTKGASHFAGEIGSFSLEQKLFHALGHILVIGGTSKQKTIKFLNLFFVFNGRNLFYLDFVPAHSNSFCQIVCHFLCCSSPAEVSYQYFFHGFPFCLNVNDRTQWCTSVY